MVNDSLSRVFCWQKDNGFPPQEMQLKSKVNDGWGLEISFQNAIKFKSRLESRVLVWCLGVSLSRM